MTAGSIRHVIPAALALLLLSCISVQEPFDETAWRKQALNEDPALLWAPHFRDGTFFNPWLPMHERGFGAYLMMRLFGDRAEYTDEEERYLPRVLPDAAKRMRETLGDCILWVGHAAFLIRLNGEYWITDPMFSDRALLPKRKTPPALVAADLAGLDGPLNVVVSHNHYDHLDADSIEALPPRTRFYVPLGLGAFVRDHGGANVVEMDWWQETVTAGGTRLVCLPSQHWSRRIFQSRNSTLWASFLIAAPSARIYFAGDSGYFVGYREIGRRYPGIDYALMPVTAYRPRWFMHYAHLNVREAIDAFRDLGARYFIPTQWGAFRLGEEPAGYAGLALRREIDADGLDPSRFLIPAIGGIVTVRGHSAFLPSAARAP